AALTVPGSAGQRAWDEARAYVRNKPRYKGIELPEGFGIVPIGPDPATGLLEFANILTGDAPRRGPDGKLVVTPATGVVMVLLPGETAIVGAQVTDENAPNFD